MRTIAAVSAMVVAAALLVAAQGPNEITNLPGAPANLNYRQYAGYVEVDAAHGRNLFYWLVESQNDPSTDPLVLWLNGGPGCSSLEGLLTENGPLYVNTDGATLRSNPSAWNQIANVVYLESPAGVGFSYSEDTRDYTVGDTRTASDSVAFLHAFLQMYPQYQGRPFWVTGESYGGHYVPGLALAIVKANAAGQTPTINLQGFQVGNAWTVAPLDNAGAVEFWWTHGMISDETHKAAMDNCDFAHIGPLLSGHTHPRANPSADPKKCNAALSAASADQVAINIYDVYTDVCTSSDSAEEETEAVARNVVPRQHDGLQLIAQLQKAAAVNGQLTPFRALGLNAAKRLAAATASSVMLARRLPGDDPDPCVGNHLESYLNVPAVQQAIHANISYAWEGCSSLVNYSYTDLLSSMLPTYHELLKVTPALRMLVYSGDVDGIVPITGTRSWLRELALPVVTPWHPWLLDQQQTGGWATEYQGLTFASVRNAGHMVPWTEPERSFALFSNFLNGKPI